MDVDAPRAEGQCEPSDPAIALNRGHDLQSIHEAPVLAATTAHVVVAHTIASDQVVVPMNTEQTIRPEVNVHEPERVGVTPFLQRSLASACVQSVLDLQAHRIHPASSRYPGGGR